MLYIYRYKLLGGYELVVEQARIIEVNVGKLLAG